MVQTINSIIHAKIVLDKSNDDCSQFYEVHVNSDIKWQNQRLKLLKA